MARRSQRLSSEGKATPSSIHKRAASNTAVKGIEAKRSKTKKTTPTKSQYFKKPIKPEQSDDDEKEDIEESSGADEEASEFAKESEELSSSEGESDDYDDNSDAPPKSRKSAKPKKGATSPTAIRTKGGELWRPGVKAGLGPGNQVVIKKPQARPAGKTPYRDDTIHPNTLLFLKDLKQNNERQWLKKFRQAEKDWYSFVAKLTEKLMEIDDTIPELPVKDVVSLRNTSRKDSSFFADYLHPVKVFRIYRDIRFTPDPTPYKGPYAHYYVQISPNQKSFVGGGLWHPEATAVAAVRRDIDHNPRRIKEVLMDGGVRKEFFGGIPKHEGKAVEAFVSRNNDNALKTKPKITYLNSVVMPDQGSSDESGEESADDGEGSD